MRSPVFFKAFREQLAPDSIGRKMAGIIVAVLMLATTLTFVMSAWLSIQSGLRGAHENLQTIAVTTAQILEAPLAFRDSNGAQEVLKSLDSNPAVHHAYLSDESGTLIARYPDTHDHPSLRIWNTWLPISMEQTVELPIRINGKVAGNLSMHGRLDWVWISQLELLLKIAAVYVATWLLALILARRQSGQITKPITETAAMAAKIVRDGDYSLRVQVTSQDEVGLLGGAFNQMLDAIVKREQAFLESESRMHTLLNALPDMVWLKDTQGVYKFCNPRFEQMFGAVECDIVGKTDYDFVDRELADLFRLHDQKALAQDGLSVNEEWVTFASDGHRGLLETSKAPVYGVDGFVIGVLGIGHDITDRKQVEADLQIAATAFESQEGMFVTDANRSILRVNQAFIQITGYSAAEAIGQTSSLLNANQQDACFNADTWACVARTGSWHGEVWCRRKNGEVYPAQATITAVTSSNAEVSNHVVTLTDITLSRAAADKIKSLAFYDPLTALPNRRLLMDRLTRAIASSGRSGVVGRCCLLIWITSRRSMTRWVTTLAIYCCSRSPSG